MVISVLNGKGGVGKTTVAIHLARALQVAGKSTVLLDADEQQTALTWSALGSLSPALPVLGAQHDKLETRIKNLKPVPDYVIIDGAAKLESTLLIQALRVSEIVIIPIQPSALDIWGCTVLISILKQLRQVDNTPKAAFLISRQIVGSALANDVQEALEAQGLPVLDSRLSQRVAYAESLAAGVTVLEYEPEGKAATEVQNLCNEILKM